MRPLRAAVAAILAILSLVGCASRGIGAKADQQGEEQRVLAAEDEYVVAEVSRDEAALRRLIDPTAHVER